MQNAAVASEDLIILDLAHTVTQNIGKDYSGSTNMCTDCKIVWQILTVDRLKSNQCALDGGSIISRIFEIESNNKVQFEHT